MPPTPPLRETQVHKTAISRLPEMSSGEKCWSARRMPPPLCLLLLLLSGATATAALPLEGGLAGQDSRHLQEVVEMKKNSLLTFLAGWCQWVSRAGAAPFTGGAAGEAAKRQEVPPPQRSLRAKTPCKDFFWKTFSSCK
ncbi:cortistatin-like [Ursus americanus]|uniref:Somatostatin/Cortistatin C-terminal domain-containing protein n=1 Tax=Ursus americanus TaxID=9643 RepID=A0A452SWW6_URSAM|nr:cortistatin-like [Ursus americanus]